MHRLLPAAVAAAALAIAPPAALAAGPLTLSDTTTTIAPGITLHSYETLSASGWLRAKVLTADLQRSTLRSDLLMAGGVTASAAPLSTTANQAGAVAALNGDFFNINDTNAPSGWETIGDAVFKSANQSGSRNTVAGIDENGLGRLATLTLTGNAFFSGSNHRVWGINSASPAANQINLFTPEWGGYTRNSGGWRGATPLIEVIVAGGRVVSKSAIPGAGRLAPGTYALVARGATTVGNLNALQVGDPVVTTFSVANDIAAKLRYAIGGATALVRNGVVPAAVHYDSPSDEVDVAGRPAVGFKDGGKTMMLVAVDGRQADFKGLDATAMAQFMKSLGADDALLFDGGGSTTLVARNPGDSLVSVQNTPSDGAERPVPNGIGLFAQAGDGTAHDVVVSPADARVFPGLHRTLTAEAVDDAVTPVAGADIAWEGASSVGVVHAPSEATGTLSVRARSGAASTTTGVRVLGALDRLELGSTKLSFTDPVASAATTLTVTGRDAQGYAAPIEAADMELGYDHGVIGVAAAAGGGLRLTPLAAGATHLVIKVGDQSATVAISVGVETKLIYAFNSDDGANTRWVLNGTANTGQVATNTPDGLQIAYNTARNMGVAAGGVVSRQVALPGQPLRIAVRLKTNQATTLDSIGFYDAKNVAYTVYGTPPTTSTDWQTVLFTVPANVAFPLRLNSFQLIETDVAKQRAGQFTLASISVDDATPVDPVGVEDLRADPLVSADGKVGGGWSFASLSDVQFTAANPELAKVGVAALERIRRTDPDLIVLNGDITDQGGAADLALARTTLEQGGCRLIPLTSTIGNDAVPAPTAEQTPCFYVPGNHESYTATGQGTLDAFKAAFGQPFGTFDHKGTRFILLASSYGTLRGTEWAQLPLLQEALDDAAGDDAIDDVVVFAHHPVDDPLDTKNSQLGDRTEVRLVEKLLSDFRGASGKGVAMVGSHAQVADVHRVEGVPYVVMPSSGKTPYGTPDRGGFTGWLRWGVDPAASAGQRWLTADVRAFAQSIALDAPDTLEVGSSAQVDGTLVQPDGVAPGTRVVPLRYPMSVHWSGSENLAIGSDVAAARVDGKTAILDPATRKLTALHSGAVTVTVTSDSLREFTGEESLAPIVASRTIVTQVTHVSEEAGAGGVVPPTLALSLGAPASFGTLAPGVAKTYAAATAANVVSTAGNAALQVSGPDHLANGRFTLPQPLRVDVAPGAWSAPVSNAAAAITFTQPVGATDALRTGTYSATLTFTLSTTAP